MNLVNKGNYSMPELPEKEGVFTAAFGTYPTTAYVKQYGKCVYIEYSVTGTFSAANPMVLGEISGLDAEITRDYVFPAIAYFDGESLPCLAGVDANGNLSVAWEDGMIGLEISAVIIL